MKTELVIFDCDGVLVDSENIFKGSQREVLEQQNIFVTEEWLNQNTHGFQLEDTLRSVGNLSGTEVDRTAFLKQYEEMLTNKFTFSLQKMKGIFEICNNLLNMEKYFCLATNGEAETTDLKLKSTGLDTYFGRDVRFFASQVKMPKPAPDIFQYAAEIMGQSSENCVVIEDSPFGVIGAKAAGMYTIGFLGGSHTQVFGRENYSRKLYDAGADIVIDDYSELFSALP